jgi:translocation and assembly module TamB
MAIATRFHFAALAALALTCGLSATTPLHAAPVSEADKSWLTSWVEREISTPDRKITLGEIDGALSSDVKISSITVADRQGVWLTIDGAHLVWNRSALFTGELSITSLEADDIIVARAPSSAPDVAATKGPPSVPSVPVAISLGKLSVPKISLPASIVGADTTLALKGSGSFDNKTLHATATATRLDTIGGAISLKADYVTASGNLDLDFDYHEPKGGIIAKFLSVPGEPALAFQIKGAGKVDNFVADINLAANDARLMSGKTTISHGADGYAFALDVAGSLESLAPAGGADFLRGGSSVSLHGAQVPGGGFALQQLQFNSGALALAGTGTFAADGFPTALSLDGTMDSGSGQPLHLPGSTATLADGKFSVKFGDGAWRATLDGRQFKSDKASIDALTLAANGQATALNDAAARATTFTLSGAADGLSSPNAALAQALETRIAFELDGHWHAGQPIDISLAKVSNKAQALAFVGTIDGLKLSGDTHLASSDLSELSGLAGTPVKGTIDINAVGDVSALTGAFSLDLKGESEGLAAGPSRLAPLTAPKTALSGKLIRDATGLRMSQLHLGNPQLSAELDGVLGVDSTDLTVAAALADLTKLTDRASGPIDLNASLKGPNSARTFKADVTSPQLILQGQHWTEAAIHASGTLGADTVDGDVTLGGTLYGKPLSGHTHFDQLANGTRDVSGLDLAVGDATIKADISAAANNLLAGTLSADIPKMEQIAPLLLTKATGSLQLKADFSNANATQNATIDARVNGVSIETVSVGSGQVNLSVSDLFKVPAANGLIDLKSLRLGSFSVASANVRMALNQGATTFNATAETSEGPVATTGRLSPVGDGFDVTVATLKATLHGAPISLKAPVTVTKRSDAITIRAATLVLPQSGSVTVDGSIGDVVALNLVAAKIPLSLADAASKGLGAAGTLSGTIQVSGTRDAPLAKFSIKGDGLTVASVREVGVPPFALTATGAGDLNGLTLDARLAGGETVFTAKGRVPVSGDGLNVAAKGTTSLALANFFLRDRGAKASGKVDADMTLTGSTSAPNARGRVTISNGTVQDPETENQLSALNAQFRLDGSKLTIERATATTGKSGTLSAQGSVAITGDYNADIRISLARASVSEAETAKATISGDVTIRGPVLQQPRIGGSLVVNRADITIPERFSSNIKLLGVRDIHAPAPVKRTNALAARTSAPKKGKRKAFDAVMDLAVSAPSMIFVRGRGVDAELFGSLRLTGPMSNIVPVGSFTLSHGSIDVIGKHITFDRGSVALNGNFDPTIDFVASARTTSIAVTAAVTGPASDPQLKLSSSPELPQDEVLAQFLFGHSIADLTTSQLVQLASAAAQLAGGSSGGDLLSSLRNSTGLDSLGTTTDASGNIALQAGRNISEHVYLGVTTGVKGDTEGTINIDVTPHIKLIGQAGTTESKAGIAYQRDY